MSYRSQRLQKIQANNPADEVESIDHLTLEDLKTEKMTFGKTHTGRSYLEVWNTSPHTHYSASNKTAPPQDDHVHQAEQAPVTPKSHAAPKGLAMRPKAKGMPMMAEGPEGTVENPWVEADDRASPGQDAQHGKCIATDSPTSGAQSCRAISDDAHRRRVERSLEQLKAEKLSCDSALTAGEIDTFDEFQMNKEKQFWQLFEQL